MTVNQSDIDSFHDFASNLLSHAQRDFSLEELVMKWRAEREVLETVESVRRGSADAAAGRLHGLAEVDGRIRKELGFPARR
jgi:hypothetical protein